MDDEQKPDLKPLTLSHCRKVAPLDNQTTLSYHDWMNKRAAMKEAWGKLPTSSQNQTPQMQTTTALTPPDEVKLMLHPKQAQGLEHIPTGPRSGVKRKAQLPPAPSQSSTDMIKKTAENLVCQLCQVGCSSGLTLQQHLKGRPHQAKMEYMKMKRGVRQAMPRCDVCQIWCSDPASLEMHYKGQKHKTNLQELQLSRQRGGQKLSKAPIVCELCRVPCVNEDSYQMHLKGRQHATNQELRVLFKKD